MRNAETAFTPIIAECYTQLAEELAKIYPAAPNSTPPRLSNANSPTPQANANANEAGAEADNANGATASDDDMADNRTSGDGDPDMQTERPVAENQ